MTTTTLQKTSPITGKINTMSMLLDLSDFCDWQKGKLIQDAMPYLSAEEREFLISGIHPDEWNALFGNAA
jgi:hypothetical protein